MSNNHHFQFLTETNGHNFTLSNLKFTLVNGNAGTLVSFDGTDFTNDVPR